MHLAFEAIGTRWEIDVYDALSSELASSLEAKIAARIEAFDLAYSRFRADSLVARLASEGGRVEFPADATALMALYRTMYDATAGSVTPLIGGALVQAGYDANYTLVPTEIDPVADWDDILSFAPPHITLKRPAVLDFGAAGKGYLVDIVSNILEAAGITGYCVDASGDMRHRGLANQALQVGLEDPDNPGRVIGVAQLANASLCASASNRRRWGNFHHVIDPRTLTSPSEFVAVWVFADDTAMADALTTALNFSPLKELQSKFEFEAVLLNANGRTTVTAGAPVELFV